MHLLIFVFVFSAHCRWNWPNFFRIFDTIRFDHDFLSPTTTLLSSIHSTPRTFDSDQTYSLTIHNLLGFLSDFSYYFYIPPSKEQSSISDNHIVVMTALQQMQALLREKKVYEGKLFEAAILDLESGVEKLRKATMKIQERNVKEVRKIILRNGGLAVVFSAAAAIVLGSVHNTIKQE